uniref:Uncharacterized protein n=1 Tax=Tetranychus urticae TaxID=32264 RepID=T1JUF2_TETUR
MFYCFLSSCALLFGFFWINWLQHLFLLDPVEAHCTK